MVRHLKTLGSGFSGVDEDRNVGMFTRDEFVEAGSVTFVYGSGFTVLDVKVFGRVCGFGLWLF